MQAAAAYVSGMPPLMPQPTLLGLGDLLALLPTPRLEPAQRTSSNHGQALGSGEAVGRQATEAADLVWSGTAAGADRPAPPSGPSSDLATQLVPGSIRIPLVAGLSSGFNADANATAPVESPRDAATSDPHAVDFATAAPGSPAHVAAIHGGGQLQSFGDSDSETGDEDDAAGGFGVARTSSGGMVKLLDMGKSMRGSKSSAAGEIQLGLSW